MNELDSRLIQLETRVIDPKFRTGKGAANEQNFWVFDYEAEEEMRIRQEVKLLVQRVNTNHNDINVKVIDLYELMLTILDEKGYLDKIIQMEKDKGSEWVIKPIKRALRYTDKDDLLAERIAADLVAEKDVVFLTGVGKAWPIIRSHTVLNNLHTKVNQNALVLFFPGQYTTELSLFGEVTGDSYYRAFKIV